MNAVLKASLFLVLSIASFFVFGKLVGLICFVIVIGKTINDIGLFRSVQLSKKQFTEGIFYYKDYTVSYKKISSAFEESHALCTKFKLINDFNHLGIYYDCESTEPSKQRSSIGLYRSKTEKPYQNEEMEKYFEENGYKKCSLPSSNAIYARWSFPFFFGLCIGISKFYKELQSSIKNRDFRRIVSMKNETDMKCAIELYDSESSVCFYIPLESQNSFLIHSTIQQDNTLETK